MWWATDDHQRPTRAATNLAAIHSSLTMKSILTAALITAACSVQPAAAQSINPQQYAERFCQLRNLGITEDEARRAAVEHSWLPNRSISFMKIDTMEAARLALQGCGSMISL